MAGEHNKSTLNIPTPEEIEKLAEDGGADWNRLVFEQSPYLLQHAGNPVDWRPWSKESFAAAAAENKPVFLSIGYSTCHWCHVMEHESFEDKDVAALLNKYFIPIKVDREERPDIDQVYMAVTMAYTGQGGWPMTVLLTPDKKPFFAGTYFPKGGGRGRPGMTELVPYFGQMWETEREKITESADVMTEELGKLTQSFGGGKIGEETLHKAFQQFEERFDSTFGGFEGRHKFPVAHNFMLLLRYWKRTGSEEARHMVEVTLRAMRSGGIFDHVGHGFHRYATDDRWLLPHFEKMLYDQALNAMAYIEAFQVTGEEFYAMTARDTFGYVLRDMTSPEGGFYSAEDADSEGEEGKFYVWSEEEVNAILGPEEGNLYTTVYNFQPDGNFREEATGQKMETNIPHLTKPLADSAAELGIELSELRRRLAASRKKLFLEREKRIHPLKDDKVLTDWNGLMIAAFAKGAKAFGSDEFKEAARRAADFVLTTLRHPDGRLLKRWRTGQAGLPAHLEDYAFVIWGLIELYEATLEVRWLTAANELAETMIDHFHDDQHGGFFLTADDSEELIIRSKEAYDGATPSGNSVAAYTLLRLGRMTANTRFEEIGEGVLKAFSAVLEKAPSQFSVSLMALDFLIGPSQEIVLAGDQVELREMLSEVRTRFLPNAILVHRPDSGAEELVALAPYLEHQTSISGKPTAYVCSNYACQQPISSSEELREKLDSN